MAAYVADRVPRPQGLGGPAMIFRFTSQTARAKSCSKSPREILRRHRGVRHRPLTVARGCAFISLSLKNEGAERRNGAGHNWAPLRRRPRAV